jgi:N-acetylglucosamine-6-phosphate deacetylase
MLAMVYRARGAAGMILTSDKVGAAPGAAASFSSTASNGARAAETANGRLAGSLISLMDGVRLMVAEVGASVGEAALMAAANPARLLGMRDRGGLEPGCRADLLLLDAQLDLKAVFIGGCELE